MIDFCRAFVRACAQLTDPPVARVLGYAVLLGLGAMVVVFVGVGYGLAQIEAFGNTWLDPLLGVLGGLATLVLGWFLLPVLLVALVGLFLDQVAQAVERRHYPELPPPLLAPWWVGIGRTLRFLLLVLAANAALLVLWLLPVGYVLAYYAVNAWLLGREYCDLVALRQWPPATAAALRRLHRGERLVFGLCGAVLLTVPLVNLVTPVLLTAAMVHLVQGWSRVQNRSRAPGQAGGG